MVSVNVKRPNESGRCGSGTGDVTMRSVFIEHVWEKKALGLRVSIDGCDRFTGDVALFSGAGLIVPVKGALKPEEECGEGAGEVIMQSETEVDVAAKGELKQESDAWDLMGDKSIESSEEEPEIISVSGIAIILVIRSK